MSTVYNLEPPTKGKVVLKTSLGDIDIELWPKEAPKAVRNFTQLCLEGYYDDSIFHRIIKDFMVQGGDPTGTGQGGESIYGTMFRDEFHQRIKFNHRGLVACANENKPHTNSSQFFITMEACPHLDRKHTIFGKVVGDSIYNVAHFNEMETGEDDRPLEPPKLISADVLWSPFEDIEPRTTREEREAEAAFKRKQEAEVQQRERKRHKKNLGLLSFGDQAGEDEAETAAVAQTTRLQSAFDAADENDSKLLRSGTEAADRLAAQEAAEEAERRRLKASVKAALTSQKGGAAGDSGDEDAEEASADGGQENGSTLGFAERMRSNALAKRSAHGEAPKLAKGGESDAEEGGSDVEEPEKARAVKRSRVQERQREALASGRIAPARMKPSKLLAQQDTTLMSDFERRRLEAKERSRLAKEKGDNLAKLKLFQKRLASSRKSSSQAALPQEQQEGASNAVKGYDGTPIQGQDSNLPAAWRIDKFLDDYEDEKLDSLATHRLKFEKAAAARDAMAADFDDNYVVQDPLLERNEKWNRKDGAAKRGRREWAAGQEGPLDR